MIHIMVFSDDGRFGVPAYVDAGQPLLFGFEWGGDYATIEDLQASLDDPANYFTVSVDGGEPIDILDGYQAPFIAETQSGPAWSWDHDGDGPGDGDGDGLGDWSGPVVFFRYVHPGMNSGTHTFEFEVQFGDPDSSNSRYTDSILVEAVE